MPDGDKPNTPPEPTAEPAPAAPAAPVAPPPASWSPPAWLWRFLPLLITILGVGIVSWSTIQRQGDQIDRNLEDVEANKAQIEELKELKATMATRDDIKELQKSIDELQQTMGEQNAILAGIQASIH